MKRFFQWYFAYLFDWESPWVLAFTLLGGLFLIGIISNLF